MKPLPTDNLLPAIIDSLEDTSILLIDASAGSGKTTRVPPALIGRVKGTILVLEPRRAAARLAAERIASERGERCGDTVGYQVRFEDRSGPATRLKFITEGLLLKYMIGSPALEGVACVILDEFHERHLHTDTALALILHLQRTSRPDLKLILMSATMDSAGLQEILPGSAVHRCDQALHDLAIEYDDQGKPLVLQVLHSVRGLLQDSRSPGDILVFLPGAFEIGACREALASTAALHNAELMELRSELPFQIQMKVFEPCTSRKIILSTNIAETSVTIEGVTAVVDSGLARVAGFAHWSGLPTLDLKSVCRASCDQRAARAGRTAPGIVKRLYTRVDYQRRPAFETPEIMRSDLTQMLLELKVILGSLGMTDVEGLPWLQAPPQAMMKGAASLLCALGALDHGGAVTARGTEMSSLPFHPRLARIITEGKSLGCAPQALLCAAMISEGMMLRRGTPAPDVGESDVGYQRALFAALQNNERLSARLMEIIDSRKVSSIARIVNAASRSLGFTFQSALAPLSDDDLAQIVFSGFPDRVCQVRTSSGRKGIELNLSGGGGGLLSPSSVVRNSPLLIALEADEKTCGARGASASYIRTASAVSPELLALSGGHSIRQQSACVWDKTTERVRAYSRLYYGELILEERSIPADGRACEEILFSALKEKWPLPFDDHLFLESYTERAALIARHSGTGSLPDLEAACFEDFLRHICRGKRSFAEIREKTLEGYCEDFLPPEAAAALRNLTPLRIQIGCNKKALIHYERGKAPWTASALQDFFGTTGTPAICMGKEPLVIHLLAPNGRDLQVTSNLESFWTNLYPGIRKELSRRYPRHFWPENPIQSIPRRPGRKERY